MEDELEAYKKEIDKRFKKSKINDFKFPKKVVRAAVQQSFQERKNPV
jgi:hypothetical protein